MSQNLQAVIGVVLVGVVYLGLLILLARKLKKNRPSEPEYGSEYSKALANSDGFHRGSLSD